MTDWNWAFTKKNPKNQNFEKMKKIAGNIIITHVYQKSQSYDLRFLDTEWDRQNFLSFWVISCPFYSPNDPENKNFEKMKKNLKIPGDMTLYMCNLHKNHIMYISPDMECDG